MGNQLSDESKPSVGSFGRKGALGLQKSELDKRCQASGLYPSCHWDDRAIRRLIGDGRIAARLNGSDTRKNVDDQECPICFLYYSQINITQCCKATICTECFLQVKPQKEKHSICPFCNCPKMNVSVADTLNAEEIEERESNEQKIIEARIKARLQGEGGVQGGGGEESNASSTFKTENNGEFGSRLHDDAILQSRLSSSLTRVATEAAAEVEVEADGNKKKIGEDGVIVDDVQMLRKLSLSSADRQVLEREMKAQHTHPLTLRMQAEAEERRIANEREFNRKNPSRRRSSESALLHAQRMMSNGSYRNRFGRMNSEYMRHNNNYGSRVGGNRSWFEMMDAFDRVGDGNTRDDDMVVLEAAILLSMEDEARSRNRTDNTAATTTTNKPFMHQFAKAAFAENPELSRRRIRGRNRIVSLPPMAASSNNNSLESLSHTLTEEEQIAMAIALSMQESEKSEAAKKKDDDDDDGENNNNEKKENSSSSNDEEEASSSSSTSAVAAVASLPESSSSGVASLLSSSKNNCDHDPMDDDEEEIIFSRESSSTSNNDGKLNEKRKWNADDDDDENNYLDAISLERGDDERKIPVIGNLKQDY